jgi:PEP-CTERM motif
MQNVTIALAVVFVLVAAGPARADIIAGWDFEGVNTDNLTAPYPWTTADGAGGGVNDSNLEQVVLTAVGLEQISQDDFYRFQGWDLAEMPVGDIPSDHPNYIEWTIQPKPGYQFSLDPTNTFNGSNRDYEYRTDVNPGRYAVLRSSLDGYGANLDVSQGTQKDGGLSLDVGSGFTDLTGPVTFRLYVCDEDELADDRWTFRSDENVATGDQSHLDLVIHGSVTEVPEPMTLALVGLGALSLGIRRKR